MLILTVYLKSSKIAREKCCRSGKNINLTNVRKYFFRTYGKVYDMLRKRFPFSIMEYNDVSMKHNLTFHCLKLNFLFSFETSFYTSVLKGYQKYEQK